MATTLQLTSRVEAQDGTQSRTVAHYDAASLATAGGIVSAPGLVAIPEASETNVTLPFGPGLVRMVNVGANAIEWGLTTGNRLALLPVGVPVMIVLKSTTTDLFLKAITADSEVSIDAWKA